MLPAIRAAWRAAAVGVLTAGLCTGGTTAVSAEETPVVWVRGAKCQGHEVVRCIEVHYDSANERHRTWASVWDASGGKNYHVKVISTETKSANHVWQDVYDVHSGELWDCEFGPYWVATYATVAWLHPDGTYQDENIWTEAYVC